MSQLDRTIVKVGTLALIVCAVGVARAENPLRNKGAPAPLHVVVRRAPACVPGDDVARKPIPVASMPAYRGGDDRIVPVPNVCGPRPSEKDAKAALRRLRADLERIRLLKEAAVRSPRR